MSNTPLEARHSSLGLSAGVAAELESSPCSDASGSFCLVKQPTSGTHPCGGTRLEHLQQEGANKLDVSLTDCSITSASAKTQHVAQQQQQQQQQQQVMPALRVRSPQQEAPFFSRGSTSSPSRVRVSGMSNSGWLNWSDSLVVRGVADTDDEPGAAQSSEKAVVSSWRHFVHTMQVSYSAAKQSPLIAVLPLCVAVLGIGLGMYAVLTSANTHVESFRDVATSLANSTALNMATQFELVLNPCGSLEACIVQEPHFPTLNKTFRTVAELLLSKASTSEVAQLELMPFGKIVSFYPFHPENQVLMGYDALGPNARTSDRIALTRAIKERTFVINFKQLAEGGYGAVTYYPVFVQNVSADEMFGMDQGPTPCDGCVLYNSSSREKWWGAVCSVIILNDILSQDDPRLRSLVGEGFDYQLVFPPAGGQAANPSAAQDRIVIASTAQFSAEPVSANIQMPDGQVLTLYIAPQSGGWRPGWEVGIIVATVLMSLLLAIMLAAFLISHHQYRQLVWNMLPKKVVQTLQQGRLYAEPFSQVSIIFSDIVSYTSMSSEMTPNELVGLLNRLYSHYDSLCEKHGIFKVETIGDCFMCVAGCPNRCSPEEAAEKAARMALDMLKFTRDFVNDDGRQVRIRVGIYSGNVTAAVVGSSMFHMCLIGDTVNVASRMESNSAPMCCHIGEPTARLLAGCPDFRLQPRGKLDIKGKGLLETFWLHSALDHEMVSERKSGSVHQGSSALRDSVVSVDVSKAAAAAPAPAPAPVSAQLHTIAEAPLMICSSGVSVPTLQGSRAVAGVT